MNRAHFTPIAEADLEDIAYYIALDNPMRAATFVEEIIAHCRRIAARPRAQLMMFSAGGFPGGRDRDRRR